MQLHRDGRLEPAQREHKLVGVWGVEQLIEAVSTASWVAGRFDNTVMWVIALPHFKSQTGRAFAACGPCDNSRKRRHRGCRPVRRVRRRCAMEEGIADPYCWIRMCRPAVQGRGCACPGSDEPPACSQRCLCLGGVPARAAVRQDLWPLHTRPPSSPSVCTAEAILSSAHQRPQAHGVCKILFLQPYLHFYIGCCIRKAMSFSRPLQPFVNGGHLAAYKRCIAIVQPLLNAHDLPDGTLCFRKLANLLV